MSVVRTGELYESRQTALTRGKIIVVPEVPRQTLSNIVRGRIEDLAGWALFQENKPAEAVTRLKRAVSVLPAKSSWWRRSMWRLGSAHESAGNFPDALDAYVKSYTNGEADRVIPFGFGKALYAAANDPKTFLSLGAVGHEALFDPETWAKGADFIDAVIPR